MSNLSHDISTLLGLHAAPVAAPTPRTRTDTVPERPVPLYEYRLDATRSEYGVAYVQAADPSDAYDQAYDADIDWHDCGDTEFDNAEKQSDDPSNQDDIDEWDEEYGTRYDHDGDPKCSDCENSYSSADALTMPEGVTDAWYCDVCLPAHS